MAFDAVRFEILSEIVDIEVIATGGDTRDLRRLQRW